MSVETLYTLRKNEPALRELDDVALLVDAVSDEGDVIPAGSQGTIVGIWPGASALEVEFAGPADALATVEPSAVVRIGRTVP